MLLYRVKAQKEELSVMSVELLMNGPTLNSALIAGTNDPVVMVREDPSLPSLKVIVWINSLFLTRETLNVIDQCMHFLLI